MVIAKRGSRSVHSIIPDSREWLSCLVCINASCSAKPSFYIFRGKRFRKNYIERCETGATMAMQAKAWMTAYLFSAWISHFIESVRRLGGISPTTRHLLILDEYKAILHWKWLGKQSKQGWIYSPFPPTPLMLYSPYTPLFSNHSKLILENTATFGPLHTCIKRLQRRF
jgi:hypothetical protein